MKITCLVCSKKVTGSQQSIFLTEHTEPPLKANKHFNKVNIHLGCVNAFKRVEDEYIRIFDEVSIELGVEVSFENIQKEVVFRQKKSKRSQFFELDKSPILNTISKAIEASPESLVEVKNYDAMLIVTDTSIANKIITETLGLASGSTVRSKHAGSDIMAGLKSFVGGELKGYTELLAEGREEAIYRLKQNASELGADAVISMRLTSATLAAGAVEIMAYGTAVKFAEDN
jgi:uncharacterized protein YbjQ (UPF0145 family)